MVALRKFCWPISVALWLGLAASAAGQGLKPTPPPDYKKLPVYRPDMVPVVKVLPNGQYAVGLRKLALTPLPPAYDLADFLPKPGRQEFEDCTAWAVARGAYSFQYGKSRWRKPEAAWDRFSPSFIYPQINEGQNTGSYIFHPDKPNAVKLVREAGCASEASCPYDRSPKAWLNPPSTPARAEARHFLAIHHERLTDLHSIKRAITQNIPVVLAIRTDQRFYDPKDTAIYTWTGDAKSGFHAICAVGYDDARSAVKLMNSWGESWKNDGFCLVDYSQFANIDVGQWCFEAHLIRVLDENPPRLVSTSARTFLHDADGSVKESGNQVLSASAGFAHAVAATSHFLYILRPNGRVYTLARAGGKDILEDISSGPAPQGLAGQQVSMLAARADFLFVLTRSGRVYARIPGVNDSRVWDHLPMPNAEEPIDIHVRNDRIYAATASGKVYRRDPGAWVHMN